MIEYDNFEFVDEEPESILNEVMEGFTRKQKTVNPKFLYDKRGSEIFEKICDLPEYYPTRAEKEILETYAEDIARTLGPEVLIIEPGCGNGEKVRYILRKLERPEGYVPIEISKEFLLRTTEDIFTEFPGLAVLPMCADFTKGLDLPVSVGNQRGRKVLFFPGSTIGNLSPDEAVDFLRNAGETLREGAGFLLGVDLKKDPGTLERAYDDAAGVTATFNLNLLNRLNRDLGATFEPHNFEHVALYNEELGRVEMHLRSLIPQLVKIDQAVIKFHQGETIHTESSYKYSVPEFAELCARAGLVLRKVWRDSKELFCVYYFEKE